MKEKFASCVFVPKGDNYTFLVPPDLDPKVGDLVVVEVQGGTFKFPFGVAQVTKLMDQKPGPVKQMKLKSIHSIIEDLV